MVEKFGRENVAVILGTPSEESSRNYAVTVTQGDPAWAGALAGKSLNLPVYHITEDEIKSQISPDIYEEEVGISEMVLDVEGLARTVAAVRAGD